MNDIDATITDFVIALISVYQGALIRRYGDSFPPVKTWDALIRNPVKLWQTFYLSVALASLCGGSVHGFFATSEIGWGKILWLLTMVFVGVAAVSVWYISWCHIWADRRPRFLDHIPYLVFFIYVIVAVFLTQNFAVVVLHYVPPMVLFLVVSAWKFLNGRKLEFFFKTTGMLVSFIAAYIQQSRFEISTEYFDYNSTYHLVQAIGLIILYRGVRLELREIH